MLKRQEIIIGYSGFEGICSGCNGGDIKMRDQGFYGDMPESKKPVFLTIIKPGYDINGKQIIKGEFYCQTCSVSTLKEMVSLINSTFLPQTTKEKSSMTHEEWKRL